MVTPSQSRPLGLFIISVALAMLFISHKADAQLIVEMKLLKTHYLSYEPMIANVTVYNRAGNDLVLGGPMGKGWMAFDVYRDGQLLSPRTIGGKFETMLLKAGRSITKKVDINKLYPVMQLKVNS